MFFVPANGTLYLSLFNSINTGLRATSNLSLGCWWVVHWFKGVKNYFHEILLMNFCSLVLFQLYLNIKQKPVTVKAEKLNWSTEELKGNAKDKKIKQKSCNKRRGYMDAESLALTPFFAEHTLLSPSRVRNPHRPITTQLTSAQYIKYTNMSD